MNQFIANLRCNFIEPLFSLRNRSPKWNYWKKLEKTQFLPIDKLVAIQQERFMELWHFIWKNNNFYRQRFIEHGLDEKSVKNSDDIINLPILTKSEIRNNVDKMISKGYYKSHLHHYKTGGSTGKALDIFITDECSEMRNACARRHDCWSGWNPGETIGAVWGNPKPPISFKDKIFNSLVQPYIYLDTMSLTESSVLRFVDEWGKKKPTLLYGHAHSLFMLAKYHGQIDLSLIRPNGIISTSMMLMPYERNLIEKVFQCLVTDRYGCEEVSLIGSECTEHHGMHMNIEHLIIEFLNDEGLPVSPGEPGRIIVTDLMNKAMPFVRYSVEDIGIPIERKCPCGREMPLMGNITGRVADFLIKKDGTKVAGVSIIENTLTKIKNIDQMQIVQENIDFLSVNIVPGKKYSSDTENKILNYFHALFPDINVSLSTVSDIKPEPSGKFRFSICKIPQ